MRGFVTRRAWEDISIFVDSHSIANKEFGIIQSVTQYSVVEVHTDLLLKRIQIGIKKVSQDDSVLETKVTSVD